MIPENARHADIRAQSREAHGRDKEREVNKSGQEWHGKRIEVPNSKVKAEAELVAKGIACVNKNV
jgi:hypothetical protein